MKSNGYDPNRLLLFHARQFASYVARYKKSDCDLQDRLHLDMAHVIDLSNERLECARRSLASRMALDIRDPVVKRQPFERQISSSEAELVRCYYSTPRVSHLIALSGVELSRLTDVLEGWAQGKRLPLDDRAARVVGWHAQLAERGRSRLHASPFA